MITELYSVWLFNWSNPAFTKIKDIFLFHKTIKQQFTSLISFFGCYFYTFFFHFHQWETWLFLIAVAHVIYSEVFSELYMTAKQLAKFKIKHLQKLNMKGRTMLGLWMKLNFHFCDKYLDIWTLVNFKQQLQLYLSVQLKSLTNEK